MMRVVIDTNVFVSALLSPLGSPARVIDLLSADRIVVLYDDRLIGEYLAVLSRPKFGFARLTVRLFVDSIRMKGELVFAPPVSIELPDRDDLPFLEVALAGEAEGIVTGNGKHFVPTSGHHGVPIWSPAEFLERFAADNG